MRAVLVVALATGLRLLREGFVLRALAWPGLLAGGALVGTALLVGLAGEPVGQPEIALSAEAERRLGPRLEAAGFALRVDPAAERAVVEGRADRAVWEEGEGFALALASGGPPSLLAEAVLREELGAAWRIEPPDESPRGLQVAQQSARMGQIIAVLFALYGVVMGAGLAWRDRSEGVLEAALTLPWPAWTQAAGRLLALVLVLELALVATLLTLHGIVGMAQPLDILGHGGVATAVGAALGLGAMARPGTDVGFSGPLSRALGLLTGLLGLGAGLPVVGAWLPAASLGASLRGDLPLASAPVAALLALGLAALACARWGRDQGGLGR